MITRKRNVKLAPELISETYIFAHSKEYPADNKQFIKWFGTAMNNIYYWPNSSFNKIYKLDFYEKQRKSIYEAKHNETQHTPIPSREDLDCIPDQTDVHISLEETNQTTKELIECSTGMRKERVIKYIRCLELKNSLPLHERYIFDLYFEHNLSARTIEDMLDGDVQYRTINDAIKSIKLKIKNTKWE